MKLMVLCVLMALLPPWLRGETIILHNLTPEEAQAQLAVRSLEVNFAKQLGESPLAADAAGIYQHGRLVEHPEDFVQLIYQANQFHGQDGLGRTMFGYSDWNQGRLEARNANGEVRGSYQYVDANGENVIVNYWADKLGFHQMDNRRTAHMQPVTETPEVAAARAAHQRAWEAAARAAKRNPDPMSDIYNANSNRLDEEQSERDQTMEILASVVSNVDSAAAVAAQDGAESRQNNQYERLRNEVEGGDDQSSSEPRGFFYNIDYPVNVLVDNALRTRAAAAASTKHEDVKLAADVAQFKLVPIRVLDSKKFKRSGGWRRQQRKAPIVDSKVVVTGDTPIEVIQIVPEVATSSLQKKRANVVNEDAAAPTAIYQIKSLAEQEVELKRLAGDVDRVDAVHDAQVHPSQLLA